MSKYFIIDPKTNFSSKEEIEKRNQEKQGLVDKIYSIGEQKRSEEIKLDAPLKAPIGRVIIKVDVEYKNQVAFNGGTIRLERQFNELDRKITQPVNAFVIDGGNIPKGAEVLVHHNSTHDTNRIFGAENLVEGITSPNIKYYSVKENECFLWRIGNDEWQPCQNFDTALRVFKPYEGTLENIPPTKLNNVLWVTSGELKNKAVSTIKASDYVIIFNDINGFEHQVIRFRPFGDNENDREPEATAILNDVTSLIQEKKYLVGITEKDCKTI